MKHWSLVLHFYQPPTQEKEIVHNILEFCYLPLLRMLSKRSGYGLTVNISGSLLMQLEEMKAIEFFDIVNNLVVAGKIELVNSALNHPLIPITPAFSVKRQIEQNDELLKRLFGVKTRGFFPPELAIDAKSLDRLTADYVIVDESAVNFQHPLARYKDAYLLVNNRKIGELLRSHPTDLLIDGVMKVLKDDWTVTANDSEVFGHHYVERLEVLADLLDSNEIKFITISEALTKFGKSARAVTTVRASTWQNTKRFDLWSKNPLQQKYLSLLNLIGELTHDHELYDQATSSCHLYWLSNWPWWHPGLVEKGVNLLIKSVKSAKADTAYQKFIKELWEYHHSGKVKTNYQKFDRSQEHTSMIK